jgi:hypothetical protein
MLRFFLLVQLANSLKEHSLTQQYQHQLLHRPNSYIPESFRGFKKPEQLDSHIVLKLVSDRSII